MQTAIMRRLQNFTQHADGEFSVYLRPNTPHCGPRTRTIAVSETFAYTLSITYKRDSLDANGFLLDNTWFASYFDAFKCAQIGISCEKLCCLIADDLARECGARCESIAVRIRPVHGVWVECLLSSEVA